MNANQTAKISSILIKIYQTLLALGVLFWMGATVYSSSAAIHDSSLFTEHCKPLVSRLSKNLKPWEKLSLSDSEKKFCWYSTYTQEYYLNRDFSWGDIDFSTNPSKTAISISILSLCPLLFVYVIGCWLRWVFGQKSFFSLK